MRIISKKRHSAIIVLLIFVLPVVLAAQNQENGRQHPDGYIGFPSIHSLINYRSVKKDPLFNRTDIESIQLGMDIVTIPQLVVRSEIVVVKEDSIFYELRGGFSYYYKNPAAKDINFNPDGPLFYPVIKVITEYKLSSDKDFKNTYSIYGELKLPINYHITIRAGYRLYEFDNVSNIKQNLIGVNYYPNKHSPQSHYQNPDGLPGSLAIQAFGGVSSNGNYSRLNFLFPIVDDLTLNFLLSYDKTKFENKEETGIGLGFSYYPSK